MVRSLEVERLGGIRGSGEQLDRGYRNYSVFFLAEC